MRSAGFITSAAVIACALCLTGCSTLDRIIGADDWKDWTPTTTSIQVHGDGTLTETIFDRLDQSWYQGNELQDMIARSMNEYNASNTDGAVLVTSYSDAGGDVKVSIDYRTWEDFARYNNTVFFSGSMLDAQLQGFLFPGPFYEVKGSERSDQTVDSAEPVSHKEYSVVISDSGHTVQVPGEIRYVGEGAQVINSHVARMSEEGQKEEASEASLYIIYEKDQDSYTKKETKKELP